MSMGTQAEFDTPLSTPGLDSSSSGSGKVSSAGSAAQTVVGDDEDLLAASSTPNSRTDLVILQDQSSRLPLRKILVIYFGIGVPLIVSFMDQSSVSTAAPQIGTALNGSSSISWVGTAFFVSSCALQLLYGRLSDIFGRKTMLQIAVLFLAIGDLLCSFAQTPIQLYVFRAIAGMGGGGLNNIAMVIVSDIIPLKERGKYQGFVAAATSIGNAIGPFVGGALASAGQWRWVFRVTTLLGAVAIVQAHFLLPLKPVSGSAKEKLLKVDYLGIFSSAGATVLLLVPISGGGSTFAWNSAVVIALLILGVLSGIAFVLIEWKFAPLPILPLHLFKDRTTSVVMGQSFLIGMIYFGNIFQVPQYLQNVKGYSALISGALVLAYTMPQALWGIASGLYTSKTNHYKRLIVFGGVLWTVSLGLQILWTQNSSLGLIIGVLEISSVGIGFNLQTTLVAALATTANADRAVVTAARNFFRTMGGAFGLAIANSIYQSVVADRLDDISSLGEDQRASLINSALSLDSLPASTLYEVRGAYSAGMRVVFISFAVLSGLSTLLSIGIKEVTFRKDPPELEAERRKAKGLEDTERGVKEKPTTAKQQESPGEKKGGGNDEELAVVPPTAHVVSAEVEVLRRDSQDP